MDFSVLLAHDYNSKRDNIMGWYASEKYDGIRFLWTKGKMLTRAGKEYKYVPQTVLDALPQGFDIDGEIWAGRGNFNIVSRMSTIKIGGKYSQDQLDEIWNSCKIVIFDHPTNDPIPYEERMKLLHSNVVQTCRIIIVEFFTVNDMDTLQKKYEDIIENGGEGIMLRKPGSLYDDRKNKTKVNRSRNLLKMKDIPSEEVKIIELLRGSVGHKYEKCKAGKLKCETLEDKVQFTVGTGLTEEQRNYPDKFDIRPGHIITIRQMGKRKKGSAPREPCMIGLGPREDLLCV